MSSGPDSIKANLIPITMLVGIFFVNMLGRMGLGPLLPQMEADLGTSHGQSGSMFLFVSIGYCLTLFGSGFVSARFSHRSAALISAATLALALAVAAWSDSLTMLKVALFMIGLATGLYLPTGVATLTNLIRREQWGKVLAIQQAAPNLAYVAAPLFAQAFIELGGLGGRPWRTTIWFYAALSLAFGVGFMLLGGRAGRFKGAQPNLENIKPVLRKRAFWIITALFGVTVGANQGVYSMTSLYLTAEQGFSQGAANQLISISRLISVFITLGAGWAADRFGAKSVIFLILFLSGCSTIFLGQTPASLIAPALIAQATLIVCFFPIGFAALSQIGDEKERGILVGLAIPVGYFIGGGLAPTAVGYLAEHHSFSLGITVLGCLTLLGLAPAAWLNLEPQD